MNHVIGVYEGPRGEWSTAVRSQRSFWNQHAIKSKSKPNAAKSKVEQRPVRLKKTAKHDENKPSASSTFAMPKVKRIRGSFSMPMSDYELIAKLKSRSKTDGRSVKKNELLRAGLQCLSAMPNETLQAALSRLGGAATKAARDTSKK